MDYKGAALRNPLNLSYGLRPDEKTVFSDVVKSSNNIYDKLKANREYTFRPFSTKNVRKHRWWQREYSARFTEETDLREFTFVHVRKSGEPPLLLNEDIAEEKVIKYGVSFVCVVSGGLLYPQYICYKKAEMYALVTATGDITQNVFPFVRKNVKVLKVQPCRGGYPEIHEIIGALKIPRDFDRTVVAAFARKEGLTGEAAAITDAGGFEPELRARYDTFYREYVSFYTMDVGPRVMSAVNSALGDPDQTVVVAFRHPVNLGVLQTQGNIAAFSRGGNRDTGRTFTMSALFDSSGAIEDLVVKTKENIEFIAWVIKQSLRALDTTKLYGGSRSDTWSNIFAKTGSKHAAIFTALVLFFRGYSETIYAAEMEAVPRDTAPEAVLRWMMRAHFAFCTRNLAVKLCDALRKDGYIDKTISPPGVNDAEDAWLWTPITYLASVEFCNFAKVNRYEEQGVAVIYRYFIDLMLGFLRSPDRALVSLNAKYGTMIAAHIKNPQNYNNAAAIIDAYCIYKGTEANIPLLRKLNAFRHSDTVTFLNLYNFVTDGAYTGRTPAEKHSVVFMLQKYMDFVDIYSHAGIVEDLNLNNKVEDIDDKIKKAEADTSFILQSL